MSSKVAEAEAHIQAAEKCLKTSFLKRKPDLDGALEEYTRAATLLRNARERERAGQLYERMAELQKQQGGIFYAAKSLEQAALLYKELSQFARVPQLFKTAAQFYRENGSVDTAANCLERGAKILENPSPQAAAELYQLASETNEIEEKLMEAADNASNAARMFVRGRELEKAADQLSRRIAVLRQSELTSDVMALLGKTAACLLLVQLSRGDSVAARIALDEVGAVIGSGDDSGPCARLLTAFEGYDAESAKAALAAPTFKYMDNDFVKLGRDLQIPSLPAGSADGEGDQNEDVEAMLM